MGRLTFEEWGGTSERWPEFAACLEEAAPEQLPWVLGERYREADCRLLVALVGGEVAGCLRFAVQSIGPEQGCPELRIGGRVLTEAKIHAFAVAPRFRRQGIGTELQRRAITRARECGCYQVRSESRYGSAANHRVKLRLRFGSQPGARRIADQVEFLVNFVLPLRAEPVLHAREGDASP